jgi:hypothetical protein
MAYQFQVTYYPFQSIEAISQTPNMMYVCKVTAREMCIFVIFWRGIRGGGDDIEDVITLQASIELLKLQICRN